MKLSIKEDYNYNVFDFINFDIVIPNLMVACSPISENINHYYESTDLDTIFTSSDFDVVLADKETDKEYKNRRKAEFEINQDKIIDNLVIPTVENSFYRKYNPRPSKTPYNSITTTSKKDLYSRKTKEKELGYARYYHYTNDVIGDVNNSILSNFNYFVIRIGNHKSNRENKQYEDNEFITSFIGVTDVQRRKIIECVNNVLKARSMLLDYIKSSDTPITSINDIPQDIVQALLKAKRQHINN